MISEENMYKVLDEWNLWSHDIESGIDREYYLKRIKPLMERKEILIITGIRRSGKSTIMKQLMKKLVKDGIDKTQILYLNLEDYGFKDSLKIKLFEKALEIYTKKIKIKGKTYFFIDEVQLIPEWERFIRTLYDRGEDVKFIVSGSNASLLSKELSTLLTGRNLAIKINTLNFQEFIKFKKVSQLDEYLTYGGFPEVVLEPNHSKKKILLQQYYEDIINKDILNRHNIRNTEAVHNLARFLIENSGGKQSMNKLSKVFGIDDKTVSEYISYMMDVYLIYKVPFFSYSVKNRHNKMTQPKYYSADNGFMQITSLHFTKDFGKLFENSVFLEVNSKYHDIAYWSNKGEVDFVYGNSAINATFASNIKAREFAGLIEFKNKHKKFELILVTKKKLRSIDGIMNYSLPDFSEKLNQEL